MPGIVFLAEVQNYDISNSMNYVFAAGLGIMEALCTYYSVRARMKDIKNADNPRESGQDDAARQNITKKPLNLAERVYSYMGLQ